METIKNKIKAEGWAILNDIYSKSEISNIIEVINTADQSSAYFRKTEDLFAIRGFLQNIPDVNRFIFTPKLIALIENILGSEYFIVKSIYFDKPPQSNWFVAWHQDLTISVNKKIDMKGYDFWTVKKDQISVQPPLEILNEIYTIRIHLDDCDETNGALKIIPRSHLNGVVRPESIQKDSSEVVCSVKSGGIMLMRPLLMHRSSRSTSDKQRRVIHIEFAKTNLPGGLEWREKQDFNNVINH